MKTFLENRVEELKQLRQEAAEHLIAYMEAKDVNDYWTRLVAVKAQLQEAEYILSVFNHKEKTK